MNLLLDSLSLKIVVAVLQPGDDLYDTMHVLGHLEDERLIVLVNVEEVDVELRAVDDAAFWRLAEESLCVMDIV